jgi:adenylate kinase family enzyme
MGKYRERISVVGTTGSGKTTVAKAIAKSRLLPYVELKVVYWDENWTGASDEIFLERVIEVIKADQWVIDGK